MWKWMAAVAAAALVAAPAAARSPEQVAEAALKAAPVWDGHNDVPEAIRDRRAGVLGDFDFRRPLLSGFLPLGLGLLRVRGFERAGDLGKLIERLEHDVALERLADVRLQVECGQLQKANRLLELRGHRQLLTQPELQRRFEHREMKGSLNVRQLIT